MTELRLFFWQMKELVGKKGENLFLLSSSGTSSIPVWVQLVQQQGGQIHNFQTSFYLDGVQTREINILLLFLVGARSIFP